MAKHEKAMSDAWKRQWMPKASDFIRAALRAERVWPRREVAETNVSELEPNGSKTGDRHG
jgi:hypothetical protein